MSLYTEYLDQIEARKKDGLHPKPIEDAPLVAELIPQIKDTAEVGACDWQCARA